MDDCAIDPHSLPDRDAALVAAGATGGRP